MSPRLVLLSLLFFQSAAAFAQRAEIPIREVDQPSGQRRFALTMSIDGKAVEVALDTGSSGLRVLAPHVSPEQQAAGGHSSSYGYESGALFKGQILKMPIALGAVTGSVDVMRVDAIACREGKPNCPMKGADVATFGIMGNDVPGQGWPAIFGVQMNRIDIDNPLEGLGIKRWIIVLPRSAGETGKLILNPDDGELAQYKRFELDERGLFSACLIAADNANRKICAPGQFDSGAPGIHIIGGDPPKLQDWPRGSDVLLVLGDQRSTAAIKVTLGRRDQAANLSIEPGPPKQRLAFGIAPYMAWSVLYDAQRHEIGVAPR